MPSLALPQNTRIYSSIHEYNEILSWIKAPRGVGGDVLAAYLDTGIGKDLDVNNFKYKTSTGEIVDIDHKGSLLTYALENNSPAGTIKFLLKYSNVDVTVKLDGKTPLMIALEKRPVSVAICKMIIEKLREEGIQVSSEEIALASMPDITKHDNNLLDKMLAHNLSLQPSNQVSSSQVSVAAPSHVAEESQEPKDATSASDYAAAASRSSIVTISEPLMVTAPVSFSGKRRKVSVNIDAIFEEQEKIKTKVLSLLKDLNDCFSEDMRLVNNSSVRFLDQFVGCRLAFVEKAVSIFETLKQLTGMDSLLDICSGFDESYIANIQKYHSFSKKLSSLSTKLSDAISKINSFSDLNSLPAFELYNPNAVLGLGFLRSATVINLTSALNSCLVVDMNILNGNPDLDVFVNSHLDMANKIFDLVQQVKQVIGINDWMIIRMNFKSLFPLSFKDNMIRSSNYSQGLSLINDRLREIEAKISSVVPDNTNFVRQSSVASSSTDSLPGLSARSSRSSSTPTLPM